MIKETRKLTMTERIHKLAQLERALYDYWNRSSVNRCDVQKAVSLRNIDDLEININRFKAHLKQTVEILDSIDEFIRNMHVIDLCIKEFNEDETNQYSKN